MVLLPEDPMRRIGAIEFPAGVMIGGYWLDETELEAMKDSARDSSLVRTFLRALEMKVDE